MYKNNFLKFFFFCTAKVLVTTGTPFGNGVHSEVIDLKNPNSTCKSFENYPVGNIFHEIFYFKL